MTVHHCCCSWFRGLRGHLLLGIARGNPGVFQGYPYPYPNIPVPATGVQVSMGQGMGSHNFAICAYKRVLAEWDKGLAGQAAKLMCGMGDKVNSQTSRISDRLQVKAPNGGTAYALEVCKVLGDGRHE
ncbi:hypothetical protein EDB83DRAFT_2315877 [Lactarius deliciosus]|nr:hypothetical protein EDB83DRAFT_2315877 [Lactarius deliciosus]